MATAILVDGGFFLRRIPYVYPTLARDDPKAIARTLFSMALEHLVFKNEERRELHRIFFYDCPPLLKKAHRPVSNKPVDWSKTETARFRLALHDELRRQRKTALRLGHLSEDSNWVLRPERLKALRAGALSPMNLVDEDFTYETRQKGVDMRIGIDIASLCFKRQVDQIVLIAGDSDFVPAAKLARREGIDFILDPMWHGIHPFLNEHIDGLRSTCPRPSSPPPRSPQPGNP